MNSGGYWNSREALTLFCISNYERFVELKSLDGKFCALEERRDVTINIRAFYYLSFIM